MVGPLVHRRKPSILWLNTRYHVIEYHISCDWILYIMWFNTTYHVIEYHISCDWNLFLLSRKARNFFQNPTLGYMTKILNQIIFFFLHQNQNIVFSNIGNQNIFLEKNLNPPFKLNGRSLSFYRINPILNMCVTIQFLFREQVGIAIGYDFSDEEYNQWV
jgi:hypothetical protein